MCTSGRTPKWLGRAIPQGSLRMALAASVLTMVFLGWFIGTFVSPRTFGRMRGYGGGEVTAASVEAARIRSGGMSVLTGVVSGAAWAAYVRARRARS